MEVELTADGYLRLPAALVQAYFPARVLVAFYEAPYLQLLPLRGPQAGGLLLKQRTLPGDCSVLIWEALPLGTPPGCYPAEWAAAQGALVVRMRDEG
jgi:hypothetical protein